MNDLSQNDLLMFCFSFLVASSSEISLDQTSSQTVYQAYGKCFKGIFRDLLIYLSHFSGTMADDTLVEPIIGSSSTIFGQSIILFLCVNLFLIFV